MPFFQKWFKIRVFQSATKMKIGASARPSGAASQPRVQLQSLAVNHIVSQLFNFIRQTYPPLIFVSSHSQCSLHLYISVSLYNVKL